MKQLKRLVCLCLVSSFVVLYVFAAPVAAMQEIIAFEAASDVVSIEEENTDVDGSDDTGDIYEEEQTEADLLEEEQTEADLPDEEQADADWTEEEQTEDILPETQTNTDGFLDGGYSEGDNAEREMPIEDDTSLSTVDSETNMSFEEDQKLPSEPNEYEMTMENRVSQQALKKEKDMLPDVTVSDRLDEDYAYISNAGLVLDDSTDSGFAISTGTSPWDEDSQEPGNDGNETNNIVRSFDIVSYTTWFRSKVREDAPYAAYKT